MKKLIAYILAFAFIFTAHSTAVFAFTCDDVQNNTGNVTDFYVVLEEVISGAETENSITCFRQCFKGTDSGVRVCDIVNTCDTGVTGQEEVRNPKFDSNKKEGDGNYKTIFVDIKHLSCQRVQILKAKAGADLLYNYIGMIYKWAAGAIGILSVFTMVYAGVGIMSAGGDSGKIDTYKTRITQSLAGLVVLFLSGLILYTINPNFFV